MRRQILELDFVISSTAYLSSKTKTNEHSMVCLNLIFHGFFSRPFVIDYICQVNVSFLSLLVYLLKVCEYVDSRFGS